MKLGSQIDERSVDDSGVVTEQKARNSRAGGSKNDKKRCPSTYLHARIPNRQESLGFLDYMPIRSICMLLYIENAHYIAYNVDI